MSQIKKTYLAFIGGSGLYDLPGIQNLKEEEISTPFGTPSDKIITGEIDGKPIAFLPRHGKGHRFTPSEVNYRANIYALKKLGVTHIVSVSAVGGLQEKTAPGTAVIPTQIIDKTTGVRERSFFGKGVVGHVSFADPFCPELQKYISNACEQEKVKTHFGGSLVCIEGPRFSTRAESHSFRREEAVIIGMTAMPEAILAREAEIAYATLAFVTDYDCWKEETEPVTVEAVLAVLKKNVDASKRIALSIHKNIPLETKNPIFNTAEYAIMTDKNLIPSETKRNLDLLYGKYWN
ncbi:S-methyl-5'-thioadenosine phosphorylase [Fluviispira multicolorata]|uniref:S-methyl-5'-thioadenosine phosphorylase n=1 Tax=Fluviispira multicolorata TaxID=2654512 RepID=A0A833JCL1_9BACT|nr:S-methyl-5'-thioadenosine phosphorylase [Fluviispira multicolorata]KAB8027388.1 S-methyl-5'-thioadenosine phosphorylase [Fluviispira multicolorata]